MFRGACGALECISCFGTLDILAMSAPNSIIRGSETRFLEDPKGLEGTDLSSICSRLMGFALGKTNFGLFAHN